MTTTGSRRATWASVPAAFAVPLVAIAVGALFVAQPVNAAPPANMVDTPPDTSAVPSSTTEIPSAPEPEPLHEQNSLASPSAAPATDPYNSEIARYQAEQSGISDRQQLQSLADFMKGGEITSPIGVALRQTRRKLNTGQEADGLLVVEVTKGSPAAGAGLHAYERTAKNLVMVAAMAAAVIVMPPVALLIPLIDQAPVGESYDMIIGVDGNRVTNFLEFQDRMRYLKRGETVYFNVVRDGRRMQIAVPVPKDTVLDAF
jgi:hypothetical protein